ncbi:hypothetical protein P170DRAFT_431676 [Aspergillus steynii IBT 23096]|uniref:BZIP domain-containing protein n=1 Tax=Aspergillus steynii IBT 23096 TaxID=1392250 RepID=A0A2I2GM26_9EURO|nr:uncharacterized protein P170DRAFT_431676 [Aspergillus steynii IBT 23096]PLB53910.1 hypothetical protein P170DRAFT_431676 [Aspergillus steynii IBT 23096]
MSADLLYATGPGPDILSAADPTTDSSPIFFNNPFAPQWLEIPASVEGADQSFESLWPSASWPAKPTRQQPPFDEPTSIQPPAPKRSGRRSGSSRLKSNANKEEREKREKFLERNRMAASKCRQKKRQNTERLQSQFQVAAEKKARLEAEVAQLHGEVLCLKDELLRHSQCDDQAIKNYLQQMVSHVTHQEEPILRTPELSPPSDPLSSSPNTSIATQKSAGFDFDLDGSLDMSDEAKQELETARRDSEQSLLSTTCTLFSDASIEDMVDFA